MLATLLYALIIGAVLFMLISIYWESLVFAVLDVFLWFICGASVQSIEFPYTAIQSDNTIVHGLYELQDMHILSLLFVGIGLIMFIYMFVEMVVPLLSQKFSRMM